MGYNIKNYTDNDDVRILEERGMFTVERSGKTLMGSAASGEGLVNVYKGTGKILMMPQV